MTSHVGTTIVGCFLPEKEVIVEELGDNTHEALWILTSNLSKASPGACRTYLLIESFIIYACKCIVHLHIDFEWKCRCIRMVYPSILSLLSPFVVYSTISCAMLSCS
jgi:hypothetical protein